MRKTKNPESSNATSLERRNWRNIFDSLVQMVRNQQKQLQSFADHHKLLENHLKMQHERWASDARIYKDQISEMQGIVMFEEKKQLLEAAKADLTLGCKLREASILKWTLEHTEDELADFRAWFEYLSHKSSNGEDQGTVSDKGKKGKDSRNKSSCNSGEKEKCSGEIQDELRRLKGECEKLALEKSSEVSALLAEKKFVWNQYNIMEKDYSNKLRTKQAEVERTNEKIKVLVSSMEQLQSENNKKDSTILQLESKVADMEAETKRLNNKISGLSVELESLKKSRNNQVTPVLNPCSGGTRASNSGIIKSNRSRRDITLDKEKCTPDAPAPENFSEKGKKSMKRKEGPVIPTSETPKLFSSSFKVPKLKPSVRDT
ncbi:myosin-7 [Sesbania bispinosa]|nr:myosin-7 [Sesbania bispinosa]